MCYGHVDAKTLERETMDRLRAARTAARAATRAGDGPPPELTGGFAGALARVGRRLRVALAGLRAARG